MTKDPLLEKNIHSPTIHGKKEPFWLKFFLEMGPLAVFFFANAKGAILCQHINFFKCGDNPIYLATALFMIATLIAFAISWILTKTLPIMPAFSGIFVLLFGFLTLWFHNDIFIKMKPTIVNCLFALILFLGLYFKRPLLAYVFNSAIQLDEIGWKKLTKRFAYFFLFLALLNEIVWRNFSTDFWASFKVFATTPITFLFLLLQMPLIYKHGNLPRDEDI